MQASSPALPLDPPVVGPDVSSIVTEDDTPVDNLFSEKQQRLFTEPLYSGWSGPPSEEDGAPRAFMAAANVGVFTTAHDPPTVPDVFVSLDVQPHKDIWAKEHRSYFVWEFGKMPDLVIEVVSNREGGELSDKKKRYRKMPIAWYVVWDPGGFLSDTALQGFELRGHLYVRMTRLFFDSLGLGLVEWTGAYEGLESRWLRWCDAAGALIPTGAERAEAERQRAEAERQRAEAERQRAEAERQRADRARVRAQADALMAVLSARSVPVNGASRARIEACVDSSVLETWITRAVTAKTLAEVLDAAAPPVKKPPRRPRG